MLDTCTGGISLMRVVGDTLSYTDTKATMFAAVSGYTTSNTCAGVTLRAKFVRSMLAVMLVGTSWQLCLVKPCWQLCLAMPCWQICLLEPGW